MLEQENLENDQIKDVNESPEAEAVAPESLSPKEIRETVNYKELRDSKKQLEKERDEMAQIIKSYEKQNSEKVAPEEEIPLREDDLVEGKHLTRMGRKFKKLEAKLSQHEEKAKQAAIESQLRSRYGDFDSVVSGANFDELKKKNPVIARAISSSTDLYASATLAYEEIKRMGIGGTDPYSKDKETAKENHKKPRPVSSVSPLASADAYANGRATSEEQKRLLKEMQDCRKSF